MPALRLTKAGEERPERVESAFFSVLVAECNPPILQVVAMMFRALGCRVSTAGGLRAAGSHLARISFNLVVSEFNMGRVNGCQLAAYVKARSPRTRVLIMTGLCQSEVATVMRSPGVDGWIFKPFGFEELLDVLEEMKLPRACPCFHQTKWNARTALPVETS
ncbi:MAG: response regulator [Desulfobacterales bacterium]